MEKITNSYDTKENQTRHFRAEDYSSDKHNIQTIHVSHNEKKNI